MALPEKSKFERVTQILREAPSRLKRTLIGGARDIQDPHLFHKVSLIAFLAWVGLGADGLSSSAYGPDEAYKSLYQQAEKYHVNLNYLAVYLAFAVSLTVFIISYAYSRIIEHFPTGGGGYVVATKLLGQHAGLVSGSALLVDYVLTITVSIAAGADAIFAFLPGDKVLWVFHNWTQLDDGSFKDWAFKLTDLKLPIEYGVVFALIIMNLRGVKESIKILVPIFLLFVFTHVIMLGAAFFKHVGDVPQRVSEVLSQTSRDTHGDIGFVGVLGVLILAFSRGAGTFTGIEAVSNGLAIMRDPKVETGKRTMLYMAASLAITAGGIMIAYYFAGVKPQLSGLKPDDYRPMNAVLLENLVQGSSFFGNWFVVLTLVAEALLLTIAAQTGFIDGPRVMSNMALDSWLPHRFSSLSERLTTHYGVLLIGTAAVASLWYTGGKTDTLVTMYAINVFITFSLTELGMCKFYILHRKDHKEWKKALPIHMTGLCLCTTILTLTIHEKFFEGAWVTVAVTMALIGLCLLIRRYYRKVYSKLGLVTINPAELEPRTPMTPPEHLDRNKPTIVLLVGGYGGLGVHAFTQIRRIFPHFQQIVFISVGVIDSGNFKGIKELDALKTQTEESLAKYVALARKFGMAATSMMEMGNEPVEPAAELCIEAALRFPQAMFFAGKLVFQRDTFFSNILHNQTAVAIQNRLQWLGYAMLILPIRVWGGGAKIDVADLTKSTIGLGTAEMQGEH